MEEPKTFFDADLDEAEADRLEALILADPELAQRLTEEAQTRYRATGSPEPSWASRRRGKAWAWGGLAALGLAAWLWTGPERPVEEVQPVDAHLPVLGFEAEAPAGQGSEPLAQEALSLFQAAPALPADPEPGGARQGPRLGVVLRLKESTDLQVEVRTSEGHTVRHLFRGRVGPGEQKIEWDGTASSGRPLPEGDYRMVVSRDGMAMTRPFRLKRQGGTSGDVP